MRKPLTITKKLFCLLLMTALFPPTSPAQASGDYRFARKIDNEIEYTIIIKRTPRGPLRVHKLKVNTNSPRINVKPAIAMEKIGMLERVDSISRRENAIVAINGSFFESKKKPHLPIGILITDGKVITKSLLNRAAMGITDNGNVIFGTPKIKGRVVNKASGNGFFVWGVNRPRKEHEVIIYTPEYGRTTGTNRWGKEVIISNGLVVGYSDGNSEIPADGYVISFHGWTRKYMSLLPIYAKVEVNFGLSGSWEYIDHVITGGPMLIKNGEITVGQSIIEELFSGVILQPNARTAIGVDEYGKLLMFVFDKRPGISVGATFSEMARIMKDEGAIEGMALDGGGSSTMVINGKTVNSPSYGYPIGVSNAVVIEKAGYSYIAKKRLPRRIGIALRPRASLARMAVGIVSTEAPAPLPPYSVFDHISSLFGTLSAEAGIPQAEFAVSMLSSFELGSAVLDWYVSGEGTWQPSSVEAGSGLMEKWSKGLGLPDDLVTIQGYPRINDDGASNEAASSHEAISLIPADEAWRDFFLELLTPVSAEVN